MACSRCAQAGAPRRWVQSCRWLYDKSDDPRDRITIRHFRTITSFTADDPAPLVPGGPLGFKCIGTVGGLRTVHVPASPCTCRTTVARCALTCAGSLQPSGA